MESIMTQYQQVQQQAVGSARGVEGLVNGQFVTDGAGVKIKRVLTQPLQQRLDPFLMLDAFGSEKPGDYIAGFPWHPHRGFETVSYMINGRMRHKDSAGNEGLITNGGVQWMTAGRGVIHSEMPEQDQGLMEGFQLWLNLPAADKMREPWYRDIASEEIPRFATASGAQVQVIAGASHGIEGAVQRAGTEPLYLDIELPAGAIFSQPLAAAHNAFIYVYRGEVAVGETRVPQARMAILANEGDGVRVEAIGASRLLLIAGRPLGEPIVQYGPFVMNTEEQIHRAFDDYRSGRFAQ
jgi:redox-sensitive bicupin YhaK (pirin superfamily)